MRNNEITPVFTGDIISNDHGTLYPEVVTLDGNVRLRLVLTNGEELILPYEILPLIGQNAGRMQGALSQYLEAARLEEYKPSKRHAPETLIPRKKGGMRNTSQNVFSRPAADLNEDSSPYIVWRKNDRGIHGWALTMAGIDDVTLGWAAWDDPTGVDELIGNLDDVETCIAIAGIVAPTPTSQMSARIAAKALRSGRKLPGINVKKVRTIFESSDLLTPDTISAWHSAQIKTLAIDSGNRKVPVAVAISAPNKFLGQASLNEEQVRNMTWQQRSAAEAEILRPLVEDWVRKAKKIMLDAGWRIVDLNIPRNYYYGNSVESSVFWVTLINPELWSNLSAAAQDAANNFSMNRTTRI